MKKKMTSVSLAPPTDTKNNHDLDIFIKVKGPSKCRILLR